VDYVGGLAPEVLSVLRAARVLSTPGEGETPNTAGEWIDIADTVPEEAEVLS
jgi:hypothetical protein